MRRIIAHALALALLAAACSSGDGDALTTTTTAAATTTSTQGGSATTSAAPEPAGDPKPVGGTIRTIFRDAGPQTVNPFLNVLTATEAAGAGAGLALGWTSVLAGNVTSGVWRFAGDTGELVPDLVAELPSLDNGGLVENADGTLTVRYEIHPDAEWSDGVAVTGDDFAFTYETIIATIARLDRGDPPPPTVTTCGTDIPVSLATGWDLRVHDAVLPASIEAGSKTFEYTVEDPGAYTEELFWVVLPQHAVAGTDFVTDWLDRLWPSAGPFVLESFDRVNQLVTLARNGNYWRADPQSGQALPLVDRVVAGRLPEIGARMSDSITFDHDGNPDTDPVTVDGLRRYDDIVRECQPRDAFRELGIDEGGEQAALISAAAARAFDQVELDLYADGVTLFVTNSPQLAELAAAGFEVTPTSASTWEHIGFHYGDGRLRANPDSLVEHLEFRQAVAHALDRDRIAAEVAGAPARRINGIIEAFSPTLTVPDDAVYEYDPDRARELLDLLCDRIGRDCAAEPPRLVFDYDPRRDARVRLADLVAEMLGEVGIEVEIRAQELFLTFNLSGGCAGWEASTGAWRTSPGFGAFAGVYGLLNPGYPVSDPELPTNGYAWGTDAMEGQPDLPFTEDCDETTVLNQGPSSVRNEFTARFQELYERLQRTVDRDKQLEIVRELESIIAERAVILPLYLRPAGYAVRSDIVAGPGYAIFTGLPPVFWNLESWYLKQPQPGT